MTFTYTEPTWMHSTELHPDMYTWERDAVLRGQKRNAQEASRTLRRLCKQIRHEAHMSAREVRRTCTGAEATRLFIPSPWCEAPGILRTGSGGLSPSVPRMSNRR